MYTHVYICIYHILEQNLWNNVSPYNRYMRYCMHFYSSPFFLWLISKKNEHWSQLTKLISSPPKGLKCSLKNTGLQIMKDEIIVKLCSSTFSLPPLSFSLSLLVYKMLQNISIYNLTVDYLNLWKDSRISVMFSAIRPEWSVTMYRGFCSGKSFPAFSK